jgi:hypothetical protein
MKPMDMQVKSCTLTLSVGAIISPKRGQNFFVGPGVRKILRFRSRRTCPGWWIG